MGVTNTEEFHIIKSIKYKTTSKAHKYKLYN